MEYQKITSEMINKFDDTEKEYYSRALNLSSELSNNHIKNEILRGERLSFLIITEQNGNTYQISRQWKGEISISKYPYIRYEKVSRETERAIRESIYKSKKMKVITNKKIMEKIAEEQTFHEEMKKANEEKAEKVNKFIKKILSSGEPFKLGYKREYYTDEQGQYELKDTEEIQHGYLERNGITYSFEISNEGYISESITLSHRYHDNNLQTFQALSDNKYKTTSEE